MGRLAEAFQNYVGRTPPQNREKRISWWSFLSRFGKQTYRETARYPDGTKVTYTRTTGLGGRLLREEFKIETVNPNSDFATEIPEVASYPAGERYGSH